MVDTIAAVENPNKRRKVVGNCGAMEAPATTRRIVIFPQHFWNKHVDEHDWLVVSEILSRSSVSKKLSRSSDAPFDTEISETCIQTREDDQEKRVHELDLRDYIGFQQLVLPACLGQLKNLTRLSISYTNIESLPPSIGQLKNLKLLSIYGTDLRTLPEEIGGLISLIKFTLSESKLKSLPASIGQLRNLQILEITNPRIASLPASVGQLQNLQQLLISNSGHNMHTKWFELPDEIGNLASLKILLLDGLPVTTVPNSIGRLQNLMELYLAHTKNMLRLPEEIGNLKNLKLLDLRESGVKELPSSFGGFKALKYFYLRGSCIPGIQQQDPSTFLLQLIKDHPFLGCIDHSLKCKTVQFAQACNRAKYRLGHATDHVSEITPKLWPPVLEKSTRLFRKYSKSHHDDFGDKIPKSDAIYQVLSEDRGSFIIMLLSHQNTTNSLMA